MEQHIIYVGPDAHKDTIAVALAEAGKQGEVREKTLCAKLARNGAKLRFAMKRTLRLWHPAGIVRVNSILPAAHRGGREFHCFRS